MKIFYQSSLPRAGSTLLQNILGQNPSFYVTPTSGLHDLILNCRTVYTNMEPFKAQDSAAMKKAFLGFARGGMQSYFEALTDKPYAMDKGRGWAGYFDLLTLIFGEEPKIICMVRDLRQIFSSMEKKARENVDRARPGENQNTTLKRVVSALQTLPLGPALDCLIEVHQRGWNKKVLFVRFEDLTAKPAAEMEKVYKYLGLPAFEHNFEHVAQVTHEDDQFYGIPGLHDIRPTIEPLQKDYLEVLGSDAVNFIQQQHPWFFEFFGYHVK